MTNVLCPFDDRLVRLVRYECSCGLPQPLCKLYFCRHCLDLRCGFCVSHEVDSHYCPNCLENMPSAEARLKKNRCANCFDCPSCGHTLSTRASSMQIQAPTEDGTNVKMITKKVYYLSCSFCRWTSRDIGLHDQNVASGGWPQPDNPDSSRFSVLQDHYRNLAQREKLEKESRRFCGRKLSYMQLTDKYGLSAAVARKRAGLPPLHNLNIGKGSADDSANSGQVDVSPSVSMKADELDTFSVDEALKNPVDLAKFTTLDQRLAQVDTQPGTTADVYPRHKYLMIKRSQRCRKCEHNLSKPEYNPTSIKFKIQLAAYYHVPEVVIYRLDGGPAGRAAAGDRLGFVLKLTNPTQHATTVELVDLARHFDEKTREAEAAEEAAGDATAKSETASKIVGHLTRQPTLVTASEKHRPKPNARFVVPNTAKIFLPARDDAAEFDDSGPDLRGVVDDKSVVAWRKGNKAGVMLSAVVGDDVGVGDEILTGFAMRFAYTNTVPALEQRQVQTCDVTVPVYVALGKCAA